MPVKRVERRRKKPPPRKREGGEEKANKGFANISKGKIAAPRRILLWGVHGVGKSTFGAEAENSIFIPTEEGIDDIDCEKFELSETYEQFIGFLSELLSEPHSYGTAVVDSLDWLERLIWDVVCKEKVAENIEDIGWSKGYKFALTQWREVIALLTALRRQRKMTIILIAHSRVERFENPTTEAYDRFVPNLNKHASAIIQEWCDEVLFATYKVYAKLTDAGFNRKKARGIGSGERVMYTTERPAHIAKNRLGLKDELPFAWAEYAKYLPRKQERKKRRRRS